MNVIPIHACTMAHAKTGQTDLTACVHLGSLALSVQLVRVSLCLPWFFMGNVLLLLLGYYEFKSHAGHNILFTYQFYYLFKSYTDMCISLIKRTVKHIYRKGWMHTKSMFQWWPMQQTSYWLSVSVPYGVLWNFLWKL